MEEKLITDRRLRVKPLIVSIEGKCGVGKSTWLRNHGVITEETVDFKVDERTHNAELGMIPLEEQMEFVTHKIEQFNDLLVELEQVENHIYIDGSMLYNTAYGAAYYYWYHTVTGQLSDRDAFVDDYLTMCYNAIDSSLPQQWQDKLMSIILMPERDSDIKERIIKRGRPSEVANIDSMLEVNNYFISFLFRVLDHYNIGYRVEIVTNRVD